METLDGREKKNPQLMLKNNVTLNWSKHFLSLINQSSCMMAQSFENKVCSTVKIGNLRKAATFIRLWWRTYWTFMTLIRSERVASGMQWASPSRSFYVFYYKSKTQLNKTMTISRLQRSCALRSHQAQFMPFDAKKLVRTFMLVKVHISAQSPLKLLLIHCLRLEEPWNC